MDLLALHVTFSPMELFFMGLCVLLLLFSRPLLGRIFSEEDEKKFRGRLNLFRLACIMALILLLSGGVARSEAESPWFARLLGLLLVVYSAYLVFYLLSRLILRRFGRERQRNEQTVYVETYSSRLLTIIAGVVIVVVTLVAIIRCPPWRAKRRRVVPGSREATRDTRRAEGAKGDPKGASERGVQSYGRPVCSRNELAMLWRNAG